MSSAKTVLLINHRAPALNSGRPTGISQYMMALTRALLDSKAFHVGMVTSWRSQDLPADVRERLHFYRLEKLVRPRALDVVRQAIRMPKIARDLGADAILNIDPVGTPRGARVRIMVVHDVYFKAIPEQFPRRERLLNSFIHKIMIRGCTRVVCVSERTKEDLVRNFPAAAAKAVRIYPDAGATSQPLEAEGGEKKGLIWIGVMTPNKDVECLLRALEVLRKRGLTVPANIVGRDPMGLGRLAQTRFPASPAVFHGQISNAELARLMNGALCYVSTSIYEGFGLPVIEAQRAGLPVICSCGGALAEVAGDGALLFAPGDDAALAAHIESITKSSALRADLIAKGHQNARRFAWSRTARELENVVKASLEAARPNRLV